jgi:hypothetical protein
MLQYKIVATPRIEFSAASMVTDFVTRLSSSLLRIIASTLLPALPVPRCLFDNLFSENHLVTGGIRSQE